MALSLSIIFPKDKYYSVFKAIVRIEMPISVLTIALYTYKQPKMMDQLAQEDGIIEGLSALALVVAAVIWLVYSFVAIKNKAWLDVIISLTMTVIFFIIGMEEISWGQRIFGIESNQFFLENNMQNETNPHNLNTPLSETVYYSVGAATLIVLPFFQEQITKLFKAIKLGSITHFLPSKWLFVPMTMIISITGYRTLTAKVVLFTLAFSLMVLISYMAKYIKSHKRSMSSITILTLGAFMTSAILFANIYKSRSLRYS